MSGESNSDFYIWDSKIPFEWSSQPFSQFVKNFFSSALEEGTLKHRFRGDLITARASKELVEHYQLKLKAAVLGLTDIALKIRILEEMTNGLLKNFMGDKLQPELRKYLVFFKGSAGFIETPEDQKRFFYTSVFYDPTYSAKAKKDPSLAFE